ncbi:MAG: hypothetical protein OHK0039_36280 [Bacteroidia bacterium]
MSRSETSKYTTGGEVQTRGCVPCGAAAQPVDGAGPVGQAFEDAGKVAKYDDDMADRLCPP